MKEINPLRKRNTVNEGQCIYKDTNNSLFKKIQKKFYSQFPLSILQTLPYFWFNLTKYALNDTQKKLAGKEMYYKHHGYYWRILCRSI